MKLHTFPMHFGTITSYGVHAISPPFHNDCFLKVKKLHTFPMPWMCSMAPFGMPLMIWNTLLDSTRGLISRKLTLDGKIPSFQRDSVSWARSVDSFASTAADFHIRDEVHLTTRKPSKIKKMILTFSIVLTCLFPGVECGVSIEMEAVIWTDKLCSCS